MSECAAMSRKGWRARSAATSSISVRYWASAKAPSSMPSRSTPIEKSLQRSRARQRETPACQARRAVGTNCTSSPPRRTRKCAETLRARISWKWGCAAGSRQLVKKRSIASPPYSPGGRLIECTTSSVISSPGGRSSGLGDWTYRQPSTRPSGARIILDAQALHAVAELPEGNTEDLGGGRAVESGLAERPQDRLALDVVQVVGQGAGGCLTCRVAGDGRRIQAKVVGVNFVAGGESKRSLEDVLE